MKCRHKIRDERGVTALEVVLLAPVLLGLALVMIGAGRYSQAHQEVESVAASAARAASLERTPAAASAAAQSVAESGVSSAGLSCASLTVTLDLSSYHPGGRVSATVKCTADLSGLGGQLASRTYSATSVVPIEKTRAT